MVTSPLRADDGSQNGLVVVFDDVSPLVRAQKVAAWREVARRLAHEIKNPLTPIQLSAERMRRHFADAPEATRDLVAECATTIIGEVESLKGLVDEFSQFARMPAPRAVPTDLHGVLDDALGLYDGLLSEVRFHRVYAPVLPRVSVDPEQMRRVVLNLVDNAVEAMDRHGTIEVSTAHDAAHSLVNVVVADDGPGIPPGERDKLFLPVLLHQEARQRPGPRHRPAHRRRAWRIDRGRRESAARDAVYDRAPLLNSQFRIHNSETSLRPQVLELQLLPSGGTAVRWCDAVRL